jgi:hypothetical protein
MKGLGGKLVLFEDSAVLRCVLKRKAKGEKLEPFYNH